MREKFATDADRKNMILVCKLADNRRGKKTKYLKASQKLTLHKRQKCCQVPPLKSGPKRSTFGHVFQVAPNLARKSLETKRRKGSAFRIQYTTTIGLAERNCVPFAIRRENSCVLYDQQIKINEEMEMF